MKPKALHVPRLGVPNSLSHRRFHAALSNRVERIDSIVLHRRYATDRCGRMQGHPPMMFSFSWPVRKKKSEIA